MVTNAWLNTNASKTVGTDLFDLSICSKETKARLIEELVDDLNEGIVRPWECIARYMPISKKAGPICSLDDARDIFHLRSSFQNQRKDCS